MAKPNEKKQPPTPDGPESSAKVNASASAESQSETTEAEKSKTNDKKIYTENEQAIAIAGVEILSRKARVTSGEINSQTVNESQGTRKKKHNLKITLVVFLSVAGVILLYNAFKGDARKDADKSAGEKVEAVKVTPGYKEKKKGTWTETIEVNDLVFRTQSAFLNPSQSVSDEAVTRLKSAKRLEFSKIKILVFADYRNPENIKVGETIGSWLRYNEMGNYPTGNMRTVERSNTFTISYPAFALRYAQSIGEALAGYIKMKISYEEHEDPDSIIIRITNEQLEFEQETGEIYKHQGPTPKPIAIEKSAPLAIEKSAPLAIEKSGNDHIQKDDMSEQPTNGWLGKQDYGKAFPFERNASPNAIANRHFHKTIRFGVKFLEKPTVTVKITKADNYGTWGADMHVEAIDVTTEDFVLHYFSKDDAKFHSVDASWTAAGKVQP